MAFEKRKSPKIKVSKKDITNPLNDNAEDLPNKRKHFLSKGKNRNGHETNGEDNISMHRSESPAKRRSIKIATSGTNDKSTKKDGQKPKLNIIEGGVDKRRRVKKYLTVLLGTVAVIVVIVIVLNAVLPTGLVEWTQNGMAKWSGGGGLPVAVSGDSVQGMSVRRGVAYVMTDSYVYAYNSSGAEISAIQHGYSSPVMVTSAVRTLTYDRGNYGLRVDSLSTNYVNKQLKSVIYAADISDCGYVAVATDSTDYASTVTVYNRKFESLFRWSSSDYQVSCVKVSNNGKYVAAVSVGSKNGNYCSYVNIFNVSDGSKISSAKYDGVMLLSAVADNSRITFAGTDKVISVKWDGTDSTQHDYFGMELFNGDDTDNIIAVHHPDGDTRSFTVAIIDDDGKEKNKFSINSDVGRVCINKEKVYCYSNGVIYCYDLNGSLIKKYETGMEYVFVAPYKNGVMAVSDMKLNYYHD